MKFLFPLICLCLLACQGEEKGIYPQSGSITESVYASVTVQPYDLYMAHAAVGGILENYAVEEGDTVAEEQAIAQIRNTTPELNVSQARLNLEQAQQNLAGQANLLNELEDQLKTARLQYRDDSINFQRQQNLWKQNVGTQVEYDRRKLAYEAAGNNLKAIENRLQRTRTELQNQLEQARVNYQTALTASEDFSVKSKTDGKVYALYKEPGELVNPQEPLAAIGSADSFVVEMLIDEVDIARLKEKQAVYVTLDAYPGQVFEAEVSKIYPQKNERSQTFTVEATFKERPERLYAGLSGEANILISRRRNTLTIPRDYLAENKQVLTENGMVAVSTGLQSLERIEITAGIDTTTRILKPE